MLSLQKPGAFCNKVFEANHAAEKMDASLFIDMQGSIAKSDTSCCCYSEPKSEQDRGFMCAGKKSTNRQFDTYGAPYGQNDVIGCLLDWDNNTVSFSKNGEDLGPAFQIPGQVQEKALFPAICLKNAELVVNFGEQKLQYEPPKGFTSLATAPPEWISSGNESCTKCCLYM